MHQFQRRPDRQVPPERMNQRHSGMVGYERVSAVLFRRDSGPVVRQAERRGAQGDERRSPAVEDIPVDDEAEKGSGREACE